MVLMVWLLGPDQARPLFATRIKSLYRGCVLYVSFTFYWHQLKVSGCLHGLKSFIAAWDHMKTLDEMYSYSFTQKRHYIAKCFALYFCILFCHL